MLDEKAQEEAPFSLLLAAVMIVMVIPIAMYLFNQFQSWECEQRLQNNMETFAREMEIASTLGGGERIIDVDLSIYACPGFRVDNFTLTKPMSDRCLEMCHDPNCRILSAEYTQVDPDTGQKTTSIAAQPVCIRIPFNVEFVTDECVGDLLPITDYLEPDYHTIVLQKIGYKVTVCEKPRRR